MGIPNFSQFFLKYKKVGSIPSFKPSIRDYNFLCIQSKCPMSLNFFAHLRNFPFWEFVQLISKKGKNNISSEISKLHTSNYFLVLQSTYVPTPTHFSTLTHTILLLIRIYTRVSWCPLLLWNIHVIF
eukprot:Lithocolla_globosa_v1_NODE_423_length_4101_cov_40.764459.p3 type:complete len:127 gc:universal NODE_423_length_4101_cov_40.764459:1275-895(-)